MKMNWAFSSLYSDYSYRARKKGIVWALTREQFYEITKQKCYICGCPPAATKNKKNRKRLNAPTFSYTYNGIDRIDSRLGYTIENSKACCWTCNDIKGVLSLDDLFYHLKKMLRHFWRYGRG